MLGTFPACLQVMMDMGDADEAPASAPAAPEHIWTWEMAVAHVIEHKVSPATTVLPDLLVFEALAISIIPPLLSIGDDDLVRSARSSGVSARILVGFWHANGRARAAQQSTCQSPAIARARERF